MKLPGRLGPTTLGDVLGALHRGAASGVLELVESHGTNSGRVHRVHLSGGLVQHVQSNLPVPRVGDLLQDRGFLTPAARSKFVCALMGAEAGRAGELLTRHAGVSGIAVGAALRRQLQLKLSALFELQDLQLRFRVAQRPPREPLAEIPLSPREFLHGRRRARDDRPKQARRPKRAYDGRRSQALRVLGLTDAATAADVQRAFRKLARDVHPDRHPDADSRQRVELLRQFSELSAAYHQLCA